MEEILKVSDKLSQLLPIVKDKSLLFRLFFITYYHLLTIEKILVADDKRYIHVSL